MAEAARHVNTMEAHHAPNWSRKQHVDGAHDKPSATSGSHGRRPHNATTPSSKRRVDGMEDATIQNQLAVN